MPPGTPNVFVVGRRVAACLLDNALALTFALLAFSPLLFVRRSLVIVLVLALVYIFLWCTFFLVHAALLDGYFGNTIGKMLFGIKVVGNDGKPAGPWRAALRASNFLFVDMFIGVFVMLNSPRRQRIGDIAADTLVVRKTHR